MRTEGFGVVARFRVIIIEDVDILRNCIYVDVATTTIRNCRYMWPSRGVIVWVIRDIGMT